MVDRIFGAKGTRRKRRVALIVPLTGIAALAVAVTVFASNSTLANFEIEGDLYSGVFNGGGGGPTSTGLDWVDGGPGDGALICPPYTPGGPAPNTCDPEDVADNPAVAGIATFFRDPLKVDPDPTTFTQGDKENDFGTISCPATGPCTSTTPWHIVSGTVPPNKDDLFDITTNTLIVGSQAELDLGMLRTNNLGSSHVDFELNKLPWAQCANTPDRDCPVRTEGDFLVSFEISPGSITQRFFVWDLPGGIDAGAGHRTGTTVGCDGPLSGNERPCPWEEIAPPTSAGGVPTVIAAVNSNEVPAGPWGSRLPNGDATATIPPGGWFEASLDLDALGFPPSCPGFGTASAKSRASGSSVTSALTDLAGPFDIDLNTCGKITIIKDTVPSPDPQDFSYSTTGGLSPASFSLDDDSNATLSNTQVYNNVTPGSYTVTEGSVTGYVLTSLTCVATGVGSSGAQDATDPFKANIVVGNLGDVTCTYVNTLQQGAIKITKRSIKGNAPLAGATFSIKQGGDHISGSPFTTDASGIVCVDGLNFGSYDVKEESAPTGYKIDDPSTHTVVVDNNADCSDDPFGGETTDLTFTDTPLSTIQVKFTSLAGPGVTASQISCSPVATGDEDGAADNSGGPNQDQPVFDDLDETIGNGTSTLVPGTYTCTIIVDP